MNQIRVMERFVWIPGPYGSKPLGPYGFPAPFANVSVLLKTTFFFSGQPYGTWSLKYMLELGFTAVKLAATLYAIGKEIWKVQRCARA